jgi:hypothetical protein
MNVETQRTATPSTDRVIFEEAGFTITLTKFWGDGRPIDLAHVRMFEIVHWFWGWRKKAIWLVPILLLVMVASEKLLGLLTGTTMWVVISAAVIYWSIRNTPYRFVIATKDNEIYSFEHNDRKVLGRVDEFLRRTLGASAPIEQIGARTVVTN